MMHIILNSEKQHDYWCNCEEIIILMYISSSGTLEGYKQDIDACLIVSHIIFIDTHLKLIKTLIIDTHFHKEHNNM